MCRPSALLHAGSARGLSRRCPICSPLSDAATRRHRRGRPRAPTQCSSTHALRGPANAPSEVRGGEDNGAARSLLAQRPPLSLDPNQMARDGGACLSRPAIGRQHGPRAAPLLLELGSRRERPMCLETHPEGTPDLVVSGEAASGGMCAANSAKPTRPCGCTPGDLIASRRPPPSAAMPRLGRRVLDDGPAALRSSRAAR